MTTACNTASIKLSEYQQKFWEHFLLDGRYQFSNQIPNLESWTRTHPGWVLNDNGYCTWRGEPPPRLTEQPVMSETTRVNPVAMDLPTPNEGMQSGGFGSLVLLAAIAAGGWAYMHRNKESDPDYHPAADLDTQLPKLVTAPAMSGDGDAGPEFIELADGEEPPPGYELVEDADPTEGDPAVGDRDDRPKFEPSPWLPTALKDQIDAQVRSQAHKLYLQGMDAAGGTHAESPEAMGNQGGSGLGSDGNFLGSPLGSDGKFPGSDGETHPFEVRPDGSVICDEGAKRECFRLLRNGVTSIKALVAGVFGVDGGRNYSPLSHLVKNWKAQWEEIG
ncbi:MAG: hypothetical protein AAF609_27155 [Cyanobacteria bacterium P01_C01_bin.120]